MPGNKLVDNGQDSSKEESVPLAPIDKHKKKRKWIEDDFFSLSSSIEKKKSKKVKVKKPRPKSGDLLPVKDSPSAPKVESRDSIVVAETLQAKEELNDADEEDLEILSISHTSSVQAPDIDKESLRQKIKEKLRIQESDKDKKVQSFNEREIVADEDDFDLSILKASQSFTPSSDNLGKYDFSEVHERKRLYIIRVFTKLPIPATYSPLLSSDFGAKGTKKFSRILEAIIQNYVTQFTDRMEPELLSLYTTESTSLIWLDGKMELKAFFKPSTLRIPPPEPFDLLTNEVESMVPTYVDCILIPRENSKNYMEVYPEFTSVTSQVTEEPPVQEYLSVSIQQEEVEYIDLDEEQEKVSELEAKSEDNTKANFFIIGLKGKDNKRIEVEVRAETPLNKLLQHYIKLKNIDSSTVNLSKAKLIFDDEELDLGGTVGDTELEEDFEVQVVL